MTRKRAYIPLTERLAAALACLLPDDVRNDLRRRRKRALAVITLFDMDHIVLHSQGGLDLWWNLDPKLREEHRTKSRRDTSIVAKSKRLAKEHEEFRLRILAKAVGPYVKASSKWANRPIPSRVNPWGDPEKRATILRGIRLAAKKRAKR